MCSFVLTTLSTLARVFANHGEHNRKLLVAGQILCLTQLAAQKGMIVGGLFAPCSLTGKSATYGRGFEDVFGRAVEPVSEVGDPPGQPRGKGL